MDTLVKIIKDALDIHIREATSVKGSRGEYQNPREFCIASEEIEMAMAMSKKSSLPPHMSSKLYTAELSERWPNRTVVFKNFDLHSELRSLREHIQDQDKLRCIPWEQRLGAARGIKCLHSGLWDENRIVVHRHVRSEYILLDENMEAKISEFGLSMLVPRNKPQVSDSNWDLDSNSDFADDNIMDEFKASMDPIYKQSYIVNTEVDVYSFGLVMFEILSGLITVSQRTLKRQIHRHYGDNEMDKLIDPNIRDQIDGLSLQTFAETAYRCLSYNIKERPTMNRIIKKIEEALYFQKHGVAPSTTTIRSQQYQKLEDLLIPLQEINLATDEFSQNSRIGGGGFGVVYKGQLSEQWSNHEVAIKRLDKTEGDEMILVYKYASNGSLDHHLQDKNRRRCLTWVKRLKICLGAAKGLDYLHTGLGEENKVIHRDVKSGNILLNENLEAKICDFGFSKSDSTYRQQQQSKLYTKVAGTGCYTDPIYHKSGILRAESDVYSFGVVMFEMLRGMPAWHRRSFGRDKPQPLINLVRRYYDNGKDLLIDPQIKAQIDKNSFHTFIEIAYRCISFNSKERPTMEMITDKIEEALDFQVKKDVSGNGD
ncbi:protein kinase, ATP binding site-containing protein [Tanacetum coccineum]